MIKRARGEGLKITCDFFPYTKTGSNLFTVLPAWFKKLPTEEARKILHPGEDKRRNDLLDYLKQLTLHYDKIIVASALTELDVVGKTIEQLSKSSGLSGEEIILSLLDTNNLRVSIFNEVISPENIEQIAKEEFSAIASDGVGYQLPDTKYQLSSINDLPHPRSFGAFPRAFRLLVKEKSLFNWEEIIYKMSGFPANILGLKDRGTIEKGSKADIIIFDPKEISDDATYDNPFQYSRGVKDVLVNGTLILDNEKFTGQLPGYVLRKK
jgi:N-acyl-D-amino-acid deacylase